MHGAWCNTCLLSADAWSMVQYLYFEQNDRRRRNWGLIDLSATPQVKIWLTYSLDVFVSPEFGPNSARGKGRRSNMCLMCPSRLSSLLPVLIWLCKYANFHRIRRFLAPIFMPADKSWLDSWCQLSLSLLNSSWLRITGLRTTDSKISHN